MARVGGLAEMYVRGRVERREVMASSGTRMRTVLRFFAASFGQRPVAKMGRADIERWMATRSHLSAGTRRNEVVIVRGFITWLRQQRYLKADPMLHVRPPRVPRSVPRSLSDDEARRLWFVLPDDPGAGDRRTDARRRASTR